MDIKFSRLWSNHPAVRGNVSPCTTEEVVNFKNQSAIRMGLCLQESGVSLDGYAGVKCLPEHQHNQVHIVDEIELAVWLEKQKSLFGSPTKERHVRSSEYKKKKGIIFLKKFWINGEINNHIDLWNGNLMTQGSPSYFSSSQEVWFWEMKNR